MKSEAGRVQVSLSADLGHLLPAEPLLVPHLHCRNGPSRQRRRARRAEERAGKAENAAVDRNDTGTGEASEKGVNQTNDLIEEEVVDEVVILENSISVEENDEVKVFRCELCDFKSNWSNGLSIHMARKHSNVEQLDGNNTFNEESDEVFKYLALSEKRMAWVCIPDFY